MDSVRHMTPSPSHSDDTGFLAYFSSEKHLRAWDRFKTFARPFGVVRLFGGIMIIPSVIMIHEYAKKLFGAIGSQLADKRERITNYTLHLISEASTLLYRTTAFIQELRTLKLLSATAVSWAPLVMGISVPLQFASLAVNLREWRTTKKILDDVEFQGYLGKDEEWYKDNFWVQKGDVLEKSCQEMTSVKKKALHDRLWSKKLCHVLYAVAVVVSLLATAAFLVSPFAPLGYVLFTAAVAMELGIFTYNAYAHHKFITKMGIAHEEPENIVVRIAVFIGNLLTGKLIPASPV